MANDSIYELCRALAQLSLAENPGGTEAEAVNRDALPTPQNKVSQALLRLVKAHRRSSQVPHRLVETKLDENIVVESAATGMLTLS